MNVNKLISTLGALFLLLVFLVIPTTLNAKAWTPGLEKAARAVASGNYTPEQFEFVFANNIEINAIAQQNKAFEKNVYQKCQNIFYQENKLRIKRVARKSGLEAHVKPPSKVDPKTGDYIFNPGTDTDVDIVPVNKSSNLTLEQIQEIEDNYRALNKAKMSKTGVKTPEGGIDTDTDFLPNPDYTTENEFKKITHHINSNGGTAYTSRDAALAQRKIGTNAPVKISEVSSFTNNMDELATRKFNAAKSLRDEANVIRHRNPYRAARLDSQAQLYESQGAKYIQRKTHITNKVRQQNGLEPIRRDITGSDSAIDTIGTAGRGTGTRIESSIVSGLSEHAMQKSTEELIDTLAQISKMNPGKASDMTRAIAKQLSKLPPAKQGSMIAQLESQLGASATKSIVKEAQLINKSAKNMASSYKRLAGMMRSDLNFGRAARPATVTKLSVVMTATTAVLMAHTGISITLENVKATDTLWDYFKKCYYHSAWEGTGIGPAFEQAQREEIERYMKEYEAKQNPAMMKHLTFTVLKTGAYMGRDVIIGVLYLPDTIWEYFTEEKAMEGYAAMQNQLAAIMRQMVLDRKDFDKLMADMKKVGLHDSDALPFLNCMCSTCGGSLGGHYNPSFQTDIGHGPCQCNGPLTIWKTPLPVKDKKLQYKCFNDVTKMRYNQAQEIFNQWHQKMKDENFKSVKAEREQIDEDMAEGNYMQAADTFNAIKPLVEDYMVTKYYDGKPKGENYSWHQSRRIVGGLDKQAKAHAEDISKSAELRESVRKMSKACSLKINPQWCEKKVGKYKSWEKGWYDAISKQIPDAVSLINKGKINTASTVLQSIHNKINKQQLPPRHDDPLLVNLNQKLKEKRNEYSAVMEETRKQIATFNADRDRRNVLKTIDKIKESWEHSRMILNGLNRQYSDANQKVLIAEAAEKEGDSYKERKLLSNAIERYKISLHHQNDAQVQNKLEDLLRRVEKEIAAKEVEGRKAEELLQNSRKLWSDGKLSQAITTIKNAKKYIETNKAIKRTLRVMQKQKEMIDEKLSRASDSINQGKLKEAKRLLSSAAIINNKYPPYLEIKGELTAALQKPEDKKEHQNQKKTLVAIANDLEKKGKLKAALDKLRQAQKLNPRSNLDSRIAEIERRLASRKPKPKEIAYVKGFVGKWNTNYGVMELTVNGLKVTGNYTHDKGHIEATLSQDGNTMKGRWFEAPTYKGPKDAGTMQFMLSKGGQHINGLWGFSKESPNTKWTGTRIKPVSIIVDKPPGKPKTKKVGNIGGVVNGPKKPTIYQFKSPVKLLFLRTYHWNNGKGKSSSGKIGLRHSDGTMYGLWQTSGRAGQGGVPNAYWEVNPNVPLKPGTYTVVDSDPKTWATNAQEGWKGFTTIRTGPVDYPDETSVGVSTTEPVLSSASVTTSNGSFAGTMNGTWQGTGVYKDDYSGKFTMQISNNGGVTIKYGGDDEGTFTGNILKSGALNIKQAGGTSGSFSWKGTIKKDAEGNLSGSGTWSDEGINGTWQSKGSPSPPEMLKSTNPSLGELPAIYHKYERKLNDLNDKYRKAATKVSKDKIKAEAKAKYVEFKEAIVRFNQTTRLINKEIPFKVKGQLPFDVLSVKITKVDEFEMFFVIQIKINEDIKDDKGELKQRIKVHFFAFDVNDKVISDTGNWATNHGWIKLSKGTTYDARGHWGANRVQNMENFAYIGIMTGDDYKKYKKMK